MGERKSRIAQDATRMHFPLGKRSDVGISPIQPVAKERGVVR